MKQIFEERTFILPLHAFEMGTEFVKHKKSEFKD